MNPWPFVIAAYTLTFAAAFALALGSWRAMRKAERSSGERP
ncbi:hypothetical protein [Sphingomonas alpina]|nr:hypothetical protein [Sphingomonas alpina]